MHHGWITVALPQLELIAELSECVHHGWITMQQALPQRAHQPRHPPTCLDRMTASTCTHLRASACTHGCAHSQTHVCACAHTHTRVQVGTHAHIHTHGGLRFPGGGSVECRLQDRIRPICGGLVKPGDHRIQVPPAPGLDSFLSGLLFVSSYGVSFGTQNGGQKAA